MNRDPQIENVSIFNLQALPIAYDAIAKAARQRSAQLTESLSEHRRTRAFVHQPKPADRITVGFVLPYTSRHSLPDALKPVIEQLDRNRFDVLGFCCQADDGTAFSRDYRAAFDTFTDLSTGTWTSVAQRIYESSVDILVDVSGHTPGNCMSVMALRPAPVQVHFLGYSITTGADFIDYLIADHTYMTAACAAVGSEAIVFLPDSFMISSRSAIPDFGFPARGISTARRRHRLQ